jgi:hypothetical protein
VNGLGTWEYVEAKQQIRLFADAADVSEADLLALLDQATALPDQYPQAFTFEHEGESITWYNYEGLIWAMGATFQQILKRQSRLRRSPLLWSRIEALCLDARYGKGRESFTNVLGKYGGRDRVPVLMRLLDDPDVDGHALYALRLLGVRDAIEPARRLLESPQAWIRQEAKKYLVKVGAL